VVSSFLQRQSTLESVGWNLRCENDTIVIELHFSYCSFEDELNADSLNLLLRVKCNDLRNLSCAFCSFGVDVSGLVASFRRRMLSKSFV